MINWTVLHDVGVGRYTRTVVMRQWSKRVAHRQIKTTTPFGFEFRIDPRIPFTFEIWPSKWRMDWGTEVLLAALTDGRDFIDIGANIGYYSAVFAPLSRRVFAFEPDQKFNATLRQNISPYSNVELIPMAVSDKEGELCFETPVNNFESGGLQGLRNDIPRGTKAFAIESTTLDAFVRAHSVDPGCIKIDTDGSETEVLLGGRNVLLTKRPVVCTEFGHQVDVQMSVAAVSEVLSEAHYRVFAFVRASRDHWTPPLLTEVSLSDLSRYWAKMFVLVPEERAGSVEPLLGTNGLRMSWDDIQARLLRRAAVS